jgi:polyhydroxyalkanoate synthase subunit PhaC
VSDSPPTAPDGAAILDEMAHWTGVIGRAQQMLMEHGAEAMLKLGDDVAENIAAMPLPGGDDIVKAPEKFWTESLQLWRTLMPGPKSQVGDNLSGAGWQQPLFDLFRQAYALFAEQLIERLEALEGLDPKAMEQLRFVARMIIDAGSPANFPLTNPEVVARIIETRGANLLTGMERMLADATEGQLRHTAKDAFELGRDIAATPGKVVYENRLFQLIQYAPTTETVAAIPLVIFPPWINRFYILDLAPKKSFVRWAVEQGLTVFMVSWKSADASLADVTMDDYVLRGELEAIEVVRRLLDVPSVHVVGYCVAGTALSMLLAWLAETGLADRVASATFFTAQVDFAEAGDLGLFVDDAQLKIIEGLTQEGVLDGRYLAATFNLLRGRDLIWNYVVNHYLLAEDYRPFDLLHWNGDVTNLPAAWHQRYLADLYRDNLLVTPGALSLDGVPIDIGKVETPAYVQAGREDHIAPPQSVWKMTHHFKGPLRFLLAGSGHIAGVVNPPSANKYGFWRNDAKVATLEEFIAGAQETKGSWWPDWRAWIAERGGDEVPATGARVPGEGALAAIEDAPGRYVRSR